MKTCFMMGSVPKNVKMKPKNVKKKDGVNKNVR